jgi:hypothetical protein
MANHLHPSWSTEKIVVLKGYLDGSGTDPNQEVIAVAGWGATEDEWDHWEGRWLQLLGELGLKRWHHTHFLGKHGEYKNWEPAKFLFAEGQLIKIFNEIGLLGIGAAVWLTDYQKAVGSGKWKTMQTDPYAFCLNECMEGLIHRFHEAPKDDGIEVYIDIDTKATQSLAKALSQWHIDYNRRNKNAINPERDVSTVAGPNRQYIPLQAADILANETYGYMLKRTGMPKLGGIFAGQDDTASPIIRALHGGLGERRAVLDVLLYNNRMLEGRLEALESGQTYPERLRELRRFLPDKRRQHKE